mmetsp:Transcript_26087/g.54439  ORF Transcript_26087/g.54439 Transcript_26087/m.54439 type:complete len:255 (-) Transcript_26087:1318-2082(-)
MYPLIASGQEHERIHSILDTVHSQVRHRVYHLPPFLSSDARRAEYVTGYSHLRIAQRVSQGGYGSHGGAVGVSGHGHVEEGLARSEVCEEGEDGSFDGRAEVGRAEGCEDWHRVFFVKDARGLLSEITALPQRLGLIRRTPPKTNDNLPQTLAAQNNRLHPLSFTVIPFLRLGILSKESLHNNILRAIQQLLHHIPMTRSRNHRFLVGTTRHLLPQRRVTHSREHGEVEIAMYRRVPIHQRAYLGMHANLLLRR